MSVNKLKLEKKSVDDLERPGKNKILYTDKTSDFCMHATLKGVQLSGKSSLETTEDLETFAFWLSEAWKDHLKLVKSLNQSILL